MTKMLNKIVGLMVVAAFLSFSGIKSARALMIDGAAISSKVSGFVSKIQETISEVQSYIQQGIQLKAQLGNLDALKELAIQEALEIGMGKMNQVIKATKEKDKQYLEAEQENYVNAKNEYYDAKLAILKENLNELNKKSTEVNAELSRLQAQVQAKEREYERVKDTPGEAERVQEELSKMQMRIEELETMQTEYALTESQITESMSVMREEKSKVGTEEDPDYVMLKDRLDELERQADEDPGFVSKLEADANELKWDDSELAGRFSPKEADYKEFIERYFYDPDKLSGTQVQGRVVHQSRIDELTRQRRYLVTNSAAHLMQVASSIRREVPVRSEGLGKMFQHTPAATGEIEAVMGYTATRLENMRALLMYAKLQSAKLQYEAARELLDLEVIKKYNNSDGNGGTCNYEDFCLAKYILTEKDIQNIIEEANKLNEAGDEAPDSDSVELNFVGMGG